MDQNKKQPSQHCPCCARKAMCNICSSLSCLFCKVKEFFKKMLGCESQQNCQKDNSHGTVEPEQSSELSTVKEVAAKAAASPAKKTASNKDNAETKKAPATKSKTKKPTVRKSDKA